MGVPIDLFNREQQRYILFMVYSVVIVEDDPWFRETFARAVRASAMLDLVGTASDVEAGRQLVRRLRPDVLLVDLGLPSGNGIEIIRQTKKELPDSDSIAVTAFGDDDSVIRCLQAGATGYLLKDAMDGDIEQQIRLLRSGGSPVSPSVARRLVAIVARCPSLLACGTSDTNLSERELSVLKLSSKGYNQVEIGRLLGMSRHTVGTYVKRVYRKLQVHSATEASYEGRKLGIIE